MLGSQRAGAAPSLPDLRGDNNPAPHNEPTPTTERHCARGLVWRQNNDDAVGRSDKLADEHGPRVARGSAELRDRQLHELRAVWPHGNTASVLARTMATGKGSSDHHAAKEWHRWLGTVWRMHVL